MGADSRGLLVGVDDQQRLLPVEAIGEPGAGRGSLGLLDRAAVEEPAMLVILRQDTEVFSARSASQVAMLEVREDERRFGNLSDLAGAGGDVLQGAPASAEYGESTFAQAA